jgi:hypothetical protein
LLRPSCSGQACAAPHVPQWAILVNVPLPLIQENEESQAPHR